MLIFYKNLINNNYYYLIAVEIQFNLYLVILHDDVKINILLNFHFILLKFRKIRYIPIFHIGKYNNNINID